MRKTDSATGRDHKNLNFSIPFAIWRAYRMEAGATGQRVQDLYRDVLCKVAEEWVERDQKRAEGGEA